MGGAVERPAEEPAERLVWEPVEESAVGPYPSPTHPGSIYKLLNKLLTRKSGLRQEPEHRLTTLRLVKAKLPPNPGMQGTKYLAFQRQDVF